MRGWERARNWEITKRFIAGNVQQNLGQDAVVVLAAAKKLTKSDNGKTLFLALAGGFTVTLPVPYKGGRFKVIVSVNPTTSYFVVTDGSSNVLSGGINELEVDTASDGPSGINADSIELTAAFASVGDYVNFESDGVTWFFDGQTALDGGIVIATT